MFLSICIPTYNQPAAIDRLLASISVQWCDGIEVIICDDSVDDETGFIVRKYSSFFPVLYKKRKRLGLDSAVIELTSLASGDYVWWIGDDDLLPGGISAVIKFLKKEMPDFLWVNSCEARNPASLTFGIADDLVTSDPNKLLGFDLGLFGFITATIFKRGVANSYLEGAKAYVGSAWACLYIILCVVTSGGKLAMLKRPCFVSPSKPSGEVRWYDQFQVFGINLMHIFIKFNSYFDGALLKIALDRNLKRVIHSILVERALGFKTGFGSPSVSTKVLVLNYYNFISLWIYMPFLLLPRQLLVNIYPLYLNLRKIK